MYSRPAVVESHSQAEGGAFVVDDVVLAIVVEHQRVENGEIKQIQVEPVVLVRVDALYLFAVRTVVEADTFPPEQTTIIILQ